MLVGLVLYSNIKSANAIYTLALINLLYDQVYQLVFNHDGLDDIAAVFL